MPAESIPGWLRAWVGMTLSSTIYASVGLSFGAILWLAAPRLGYEPWACLFVGSCIPPGPMAWYIASDFAFERRLIRLKRWHDEGWINDEEYAEDRTRARAWRNDRLYGKGSTARTARRTSRRKPAEPTPPEPES